MTLNTSVADAFLTPGSGSGITTRIIILRAYKQFFGLKYLNSLLWIRNSGWKKFGSGIRDKHPGSATLPSANTEKSLGTRYRVSTVQEKVPLLILCFVFGPVCNLQPNLVLYSRLWGFPSGPLAERGESVLRVPDDQRGGEAHRAHGPRRHQQQASGQSTRYPWHFHVDPDPRIPTSNKWIRILSTVTLNEIREGSGSGAHGPGRYQQQASGQSTPHLIYQQCWGSVTLWCGSGSSDPYL